MKILSLILLLATGGIAQASVIPIIVDLGPPAEHFQSEFFGLFSAVNGPIPADGHVTFDVIFKDSNFIRLTERTIQKNPPLPFWRFSAFIETTFMDFYGVSESAYTFDANGNANSSVQTRTISDHIVAASFPAFIEPELDKNTDFPFLIYGAHFDFYFPLENKKIFNLELGIKTNRFWAVGPHVPDTGASAGLLALAMAGLVLIKKTTGTK